MNDVIEHLRRTMLRQHGAGLTDGQLLDDYLSRQDEAALAALVHRHGPMVWGVCRRVLRNYHDAEDAFQATFLVLVRKAASIASRELLANWLYGVAHQTALKARATTARRKERERQVSEMPEPAVTVQELWRDLQPLLDEELSRLPEKYRVLVVLCDLEGKSRKEVAQQLRCPEGTVAGRLARARATLASRLAKRGVVLSAGTLAMVLSRNVASAGVPISLVSSTIKAATELAAWGAAAASLISARVAALTEGVRKAMLLTKHKTIMMLAGALSIIALGAGFTAYHGFAQQPADDNKKSIAPAAKEPANKEAEKKAEAQYCWLVFGPKGKVRTLMRLSGEEVAVDRDGDGKFDSKGERFKSEKDCKDVVIKDPDGKTSYVITFVESLKVVPPERFLEIRVRIRGEVSYPQCCIIGTADRPKGAPEAHFHGPLTIDATAWTIENRATHVVKNDFVNLGFLVPESLKKWAGKGIVEESGLPRSLKRTGEPTNLYAAIRTSGENGVVSVCSPGITQEERREKAPFPKGVHPFVDVEFPAKKPGDPAIKKRYPLDRFCCDGLFGGSIRVPDDAGAGKAKVTFSFAAWKGVKVAPSTVEIAVDELPSKRTD